MSNDVEIVLCDRQPDVVDAWTRVFAEAHPEVRIVHGDILEQDADALLLPGNAFGFLDRGLELDVCERWGWSAQDVLRELVRSEFWGELLVGQAAVGRFRSNDGRERTIVYSSIYRTPTNVSGSLAAYLSARGAFLALRGEQGAGVRRLAIPGLATGSAGLHAAASARQLRYAYRLYRGLRGFGDKNLSQLTRRAKRLASIPPWAFGEEGGDDDE